jgi:hypothetical protein
MLVIGRVTAGDAAPPAAPKVSTFAPAADLVSQADKYITELAKAVADEAEYKDLPEGKIARDSNTLIVIALALGLHDEDNKYQASAGAILKAAQEVAAAKDYAATKKAVAAVKAAAAGQGKAAGKPAWTDKVASLEQLMKHVPNINTRLQSQVKRLDTRAKEVAGNAAVLAVIAQASMPHVSDTKYPQEVEKWYSFCVEMRDAAAGVNAAARAKNKAGIEAAVTKLNPHSCDNCHAVFHKEAEKAKQEAEKAK